MLVKQVMHKEVLTVNPEVSLQEAARTMADNRVGSLVVVRERMVQGIITEHDMIRAIAEGDVSGNVKGIMTPYVYSVSPGQKIDSAIGLMREHRIKKLPVMDGRRLVGIVTATDIMTSHPELIKELKSLMRK